MKRIVELEGKPASPSSDDARQLLTEVLLNLFPTQPDWVASFSQIFEIYEFQLGDELNQGQAPDQVFEAPTRLHILCQGRVRLVDFDPIHQQEIPVTSLASGEVWGADSYFCQHPLPYRAVGASPGLVATVSIAQLKPWTEQVPQLREFLHTLTQTRQQLIFFKLKTPYRSCPSQVLKSALLDLKEINVAVGANLSEVIPNGHFWLKSGEVQSLSGVAQALPKIGESWGYPDPVPSDWVAATDLRLYWLSSEHWDEVQPLLFTKEHQLQGQDTLLHRRRVPQATARFRLDAAPATNATTTTTPNHQSPSATRLESQMPTIDFAKPGRSRYRRRLFGPNYPFIPQQSSSDCGAACLAMVAQYWGKRLNLNMLRSLAGVGRSGASLKGLVNAAERLGFQARPVRSSFNRLAEQTTPWIAHWQGDHYVVVYRVKGNKVLLSDPALGRRSLNLDEFQTGWTGYALLLSPTDLLTTTPNAKPSFSRIWGAIWPYRSMVWPILLASVLLQLFGLVTPLFTQIILDRVVVHKSLLTLQVFAIGLLIFGFWRIGLTGIRQYLLDYFSNQIDLTLISGFISHALNLPLQFFATRHVGDIVTRVQENHKIQQFLTRQAITAWLDASMAIVYVGLMLYYNWQLTLLVLAMLPPIILLTVLASPFLRRVSRQVFMNQPSKTLLWWKF